MFDNGFNWDLISALFLFLYGVMHVVSTFLQKLLPEMFCKKDLNPILIFLIFCLRLMFATFVLYLALYYWGKANV